MKYLVMALLCLQMACKFELPKDDKEKDKDETGKIVYLGRLNRNMDRLVFTDYDMAGFPTTESSIVPMLSPLPPMPFREYVWDFKLGRVTLSGECQIERTITAQEEEQLQGLLKTFEYCRYEGPRPICPEYLILTYANVYYEQNSLSIDRMPVDGCWYMAKACSSEKLDLLKALNEQLTRTDLANCPPGVSN